MSALTPDQIEKRRRLGLPVPDAAPAAAAAVPDAAPAAAETPSPASVLAPETARPRRRRAEPTTPPPSAAPVESSASPSAETATGAVHLPLPRSARGPFLLLGCVAGGAVPVDVWAAAQFGAVGPTNLPADVRYLHVEYNAGPRHVASAIAAALDADALPACTVTCAADHPVAPFLRSVFLARQLTVIVPA